MLLWWLLSSSERIVEDFSGQRRCPPSAAFPPLLNIHAAFLAILSLPWRRHDPFDRSSICVAVVVANNVSAAVSRIVAISATLDCRQATAVKLLGVVVVVVGSDAAILLLSGSWGEGEGLGERGIERLLVRIGHHFLGFAICHGLILLDLTVNGSLVPTWLEKACRESGLGVFGDGAWLILILLWCCHYCGNLAACRRGWRELVVPWRKFGRRDEIIGLVHGSLLHWYRRWFHDLSWTVFFLFFLILFLRSYDGIMNNLIVLLLVIGNELWRMMLIL